MANKLLILGAAMAHKNKSYNLSNPIVKAVDDSLAKFTKILQQRQKSIAQTSIRTQGYLDQLPENPEVELLLICALPLLPILILYLPNKFLLIIFNSPLIPFLPNLGKWKVLLVNSS